LRRTACATTLRSEQIVSLSVTTHNAYLNGATNCTAQRQKSCLKKKSLENNSVPQTQNKGTKAFLFYEGQIEKTCHYEVRAESEGNEIGSLKGE